MHIRPLTTLDECRRVAALEKTVWGYADAEDVVPPPVLIVSIKRGGILLGAFDDGGDDAGLRLLDARAQGRPADAVVAHARRVARLRAMPGLGARLKLAQRDAALAMGLDLIEWTFDPLQALNAHFNFAKLGVVVEEYEENVYGESSSPLHRGAPTDRFVAEWRITTPHVERRIAPAGSRRSGTAGCCRRRWSIRHASSTGGCSRAMRTCHATDRGCWSRSRPASTRCWRRTRRWRSTGA